MVPVTIVELPDGRRRVVDPNTGRRFGTYRTQIMAEYRVAQILNSRRPRKEK